MESIFYWIIGILIIILLVLMIWYFWPSNNGPNEVVILKDSKKLDLDTPILEGKPVTSSQHIADDTSYTPNETPTISMSDYAPIESDDEEEVIITGGLQH